MKYVLTAGYLLGIVGMTACTVLGIIVAAQWLSDTLTVQAMARVCGG